jgi:monoamine oxidase
VPDHRAAAMSLVMGPVVRLTLQCREQFWASFLPAAQGAQPDLSFLHAEDEPFSTWWTPYPLQAPLLTAWAGGPKAALLEEHSHAEQAAMCLQTLARVTGLPHEALEGQVIRTHAHDWQRDPYARGAYSSVPVGALPAVETLGRPCAETLYFAGEATDTTGHTGTVHGALASGLRAARQILAGRP